MTDKKKPRYSGPGHTQICVCGHPLKEHHLTTVARPEYVAATGEHYVPWECEHFGKGEHGGLGPDGKIHCMNYFDEGARS